MSKAVLSDHDYGGVSRALNLPAPVNAGDAAPKSYVDGLFGGGGVRILAPALGDGTTKVFSLSLSVPAALVTSCLVFEGGLLQRDTTDYTITGSTLTFVAAPASGVVVGPAYYINAKPGTKSRPSIVQSATRGSAGPATGSLVFLTALTTGNLLVIAVAVAGNNAPTTPTGFTLAASQPTNPALYVYTKVITDEVLAVAFTFGTADVYASLIGFEVSGATKVDATSTANTQTNTAALACPALTTNKAGDLIIEFATQDSSYYPVAASAGYDLGPNVIQSYHSAGAAYSRAVTGAAGSYTPGTITWSTASTTSVLALALSP